MIYAIITLSSLILFILVMLLPQRIAFYVDDKYVEVYVFRIRIFKMEFTKTADYAVEQVIKYKPTIQDLEYLKITRKIKFEVFEINIGHVIEDYARKNMMTGYLYGIFEMARTWFPYNRYKVIISKDNNNYFAFRSIFHFRLGKILVTFFSLRRKINARTSN